MLAAEPMEVGARPSSRAGRSRPGSARPSGRPTTSTTTIPTTVATTTFRAYGDRVQVKLPEWTKFYGANVAAVYPDGTYDVNCDDGEQLKKVDESCLQQTTTTAAAAAGAGAATGAATVGATYRPGDEVMAQIDGWNRPYKAVINRQNVDGTFDLKFEDGDRVDGVGPEVFVTPHQQGQQGQQHQANQKQAPPPPQSPTQPERQEQQERQRPTEPTQPTQPTQPPRPSWTAGDRIEARAPGWTSFYKGTIINVHADEAVDVKFDDGDFKRNLRGIEIRRLGTHRDSSASPVRKGRRPRPHSAAPDRPTTNNRNNSSHNSNNSNNANKQPMRPSSAPRARNTAMPVGGGLTFAQWKRKTTQHVYANNRYVLTGCRCFDIDSYCLVLTIPVF
jgi:hypothetical protein